MNIGLLFCLLLGSFLSVLGQSFGSKPLFIEEIKVTGTRTLDSTRLNEIVGPLNQLKVEGTEEIKERLRARFQDFGYFDATVDRFEAKPIDPLANPVRVFVEAQVSEGTRYRLGTIEFKEIHALNAEELRAQFPIRKGDYFSRGKIASGLEAMRKTYCNHGYIMFTAVPDTIKSDNGTINLLLDVDEGKQYRMGSLQFVGNDQLGDLLRRRWELESGQPFDASYIERFFKNNESLLPPEFDMSRSIALPQNCKKGTVSVFIELGPNHPPVPALQDVACDPASEQDRPTLKPRPE